MEKNNSGSIEQTHEGVQTETANTDEKIVMTKSEFFRAIDKARTEAAKTREINVQKKVEMTLSELQTEIEMLKEQNRKKDLIIETKNRLTELDSLDILPFFDYDLNELDQRIEFAKRIKEHINGLADKKIKEKLASPSPPIVRKNESKPELNDLYKKAFGR
jgi:hypothetical protein